MPAPSKAWVAIADTQVDADSPLDTTLVTAIRDDLVHVEEWLGKDYTADQNHFHDGIGSKKINSGDISTIGEIYDDFTGVAVDAAKWTQVVSGSLAIGSSSGGRVCGVLVVGITTASGAGGVHTTGFPQFTLGASNTLTFETRYKGTDSYIPTDGCIGFAASWVSNPANAISFEVHGGSNWLAKTRSGGTETSTDTGVAVSTSAWQKLKIVAVTGSVLFYIDDVLKATITTNIPSVDLGTTVNLWRSVQNPYYHLDYVTATNTVRNN